MPFSLIYFFAPVSIFYIPHNYVIPQAMPHAIPQTHSAFCPHRFKGSLKSPNVTANVWVMEVEVGGIQTLSPYRWQFSFSKVWMLSINTSLASLLKRDLKKEITIDLILIEDSRGKKTQGLDDLDLTLHTYKGEYILTWQLTHLLCRLNFRSPGRSPGMISLCLSASRIHNTFSISTRSREKKIRQLFYILSGSSR